MRGSFGVSHTKAQDSGKLCTMHQKGLILPSTAYGVTLLPAELACTLTVVCSVRLPSCRVACHSLVQTYMCHTDWTSRELHHHPVQAPAFQALNAYLEDTLWGSICLFHCGPEHQLLHPLDFHAVISRLDHDVAAQLTAGACWAQLCSQETQRLKDSPDSTLSHSYCRAALVDATFEPIARCIAKAASVSSLWCLLHVVTSLTFLSELQVIILLSATLLYSLTYVYYA